MGRNNYTGLLYAEPSFTEGLARTLDIGAVFDDYNYAPSPLDADRLATASDWYAVGADLHQAFVRFARAKVRPRRRDDV